MANTEGFGAADKVRTAPGNADLAGKPQNRGYSASRLSKENSLQSIYQRHSKMMGQSQQSILMPKNQQGSITEANTPVHAEEEAPLDFESLKEYKK